MKVSIEAPDGYVADASTKAATVFDQSQTRVDFYLTEPDNEPPILDLPADIVVEATAPTGAAVTYVASAMDGKDGELVPSCTPASGSRFALGDTTVTCEASDAAGNNVGGSFRVRVVDTTPPIITASVIPEANANGWNKEPVTVSFDCQDKVSGIAACSAPAVLGEGADQSALGTARDNAGNTTETRVTGINVDLSGPLVRVTGVGEGASYTPDSLPAVDCTTVDVLSGVESHATARVAGGDPNGLGVFTASCSGALDRAGNPGAASVTFEVIGTPSGTFSDFGNFDVEQLRINQSSHTLLLLSTATLGGNSDGMDPETDPITLRVADFMVTIPAGSLHISPQGVYGFAGQLEDAWVQVLINPLGDGRFGFQAVVNPVRLNDPSNPMAVALEIGNDRGTASVDVGIR
jgi:hypothetical protein